MLTVVVVLRVTFLCHLFFIRFAPVFALVIETQFPAMADYGFSIIPKGDHMRCSFPTKKAPQGRIMGALWSGLRSSLESRHKYQLTRSSVGLFACTAPSFAGITPLFFARALNCALSFTSSLNHSLPSSWYSE